ncbi:MAG: hypothetical protein JWS12_768 [Candidatus Saccharibacteria bacterium]|nr:hypothetical protein [Candidatus Saccharibacteria bacterium]
MKIGYLFDDSLDRPDGVQQYVRTVGQWQQAHGHEVHYLVSQTESSNLPNVHSLSRSVAVRFNGNRLSVPRLASRQVVKQCLEDLQLDLLHVQLPYSPLMSGRVMKYASPKTALVGTFHILPANRLAQFGSRLLGAVEHRQLQRFDDIVAVSQPAQSFARAYYGIQSTVVPNPIDLSRYVGLKKSTTGMLTIAFLGRLVERKGSQHLLEAVYQLKQRTNVPAFRVVIGGRGPLLPLLQQKVADHQLTDVVKFSGFIDEPAKPSFLASADIAVFPATGGESFGIVLLEAMAAGAGVVLGGNNPGYASVLANQADFLFDPTNTVAFADTLADLLKHENKRQQLHQLQQELVRRYDINRIGQQLHSIYQAALRKRRDMR